MPGRTPDLCCDRLSQLTTDSLAMQFFNKYYRFEVLGCASQILVIYFSQTVRCMKQSLVIYFVPIIRVPTRSSCSDSIAAMAGKLERLLITTTTKVPVTTPDKMFTKTFGHE